MSVLAEVGARLYEQSTIESPLGRYRGSIHCSEDAYALHFHLGDDRGIVVTLDRDTDLDVTDLSYRCESLLYD